MRSSSTSFHVYFHAVFETLLRSQWCGGCSKAHKGVIDLTNYMCESCGLKHAHYGDDTNYLKRRWCSGCSKKRIAAMVPAMAPAPATATATPPQAAGDSSGGWVLGSENIQSDQIQALQCEHIYSSVTRGFHRGASTNGRDHLSPSSRPLPGQKRQRMSPFGEHGPHVPADNAVQFMVQLPENWLVSRIKLETDSHQHPGRILTAAQQMRIEMDRGLVTAVPRTGATVETIGDDDVAAVTLHAALALLGGVTVPPTAAAQQQAEAAPATAPQRERAALWSAPATFSTVAPKWTTPPNCERLPRSVPSVQHHQLLGKDRFGEAIRQHLQAVSSSPPLCSILVPGAARAFAFAPAFAGDSPFSAAIFMDRPLHSCGLTTRSSVQD